MADEEVGTMTRPEVNETFIERFGSRSSAERSSGARDGAATRQ
jgi:hypothetical protein